MMNTLKSLLLTAVLTVCHSATASQSFSRADVLTDLNELHQSLIDTHYNAFAYTSEQALQQTFEALQHQVTRPTYSLLETVNLYQQLVSSLNNGHTEIDFPVQPYLDYAEADGTLFPLEIAFEHEVPRVRKNFSGDSSVVMGAEVLSINGRKLEEILADIYPQISAERRYFKHAKLELLTFPRYYWRVFGEQSAFTVELRSGDRTTTHTLSAIKAMDDYEMKRDDIISSQRNVAFYGRIAYIKPGNFSGDEQAYRTFVDNAFKQVSEKNTPSLILDLRNNAGGNDAFSDYLVSYFADKPFRWYGAFSLKTSKRLKADTRANRDLDNPYWQAILQHADGEVFEYHFDEYKPKPPEARFHGQVYVLINRQSHSQAAVTAAQIQDYGWATLVGEETGDFPSLYASQFQYALPKTQITVRISKGRIVRVSGDTRQRGVIPDIAIKDYLLDDHDEVLQGLLEKMAGSD